MLSTRLILGGIIAVLIGGLGLFSAINSSDKEASNVEVKTEVPALGANKDLFIATSTPLEEVVSANTESVDNDDVTPNEELLEDIEIKKEETETPSLEESPQLVEEEIDYSSYSNFISVEDLEDIDEKDINIKAIVLVRCMYTSQYYGETTAIDDEFTFILGTGFFVNPNGTILTAGHVVRKKTFESSSSDRIWSVKKCQIARTKQYFDEIRSFDKRFRGGEGHFEDVDIIYEPSEDIYDDTDGMDVAVLRLKESSNDNPYFELIPKMVELDTDKYGPVSVGYPGTLNSVMQKIERIDSVFLRVDSREGSDCIGKDFLTPCGWRYFLYRDLADLKALESVRYQLGYYTRLGVQARNARGGFSGSPVLINGNVIGILTHSAQSDGSFLTLGVDIPQVLTSYDIIEHLKAEGISI